MTGADLLVLLSDIDGLYTAPPHLDPDASFSTVLQRSRLKLRRWQVALASELSRGGMRTKIDAGKIATAAGCGMIIASGKTLNPLRAIDEGARSSWFAPSGTPVTARKTWIAGQLQPAGEVHVDAGAQTALYAGKSLLPAGMCGEVSGNFGRGARAVSSAWTGVKSRVVLPVTMPKEARQITGHKSSEIEAILGYVGRSAMIHRDDLVMTGASSDRISRKEG